MIIITQSINHSKSDQSKLCDAILTNVKKAEVLVEICFICHKSDHSFRKCLNRSTKINAMNKEYDCFNFDSNFDLKN